MNDRTKMLLLVAADVFVFLTIILSITVEDNSNMIGIIQCILFCFGVTLLGLAHYGKIDP